MIAALTLIIITLDQATKFLVSNHSDKLPIEVVKGIFAIALVRNKGAAFGILQNQIAFFISIAVVTITIIIFMLRKNASGALLKVSLALILGGAIGNLIDRIRFGYVIDFLDFKIWPVFNIADSAITIGAGLLLLQILSHKLKMKNGK